MSRLGPFSENTIVVGDCLDIMAQVPGGCVDLVVADPPYNVSKAGGRHGFRGKRFVDANWDRIEDYPAFSRMWLKQCRRLMTATATIYVWCYCHSIPYLPLDMWYPLNLLVWRKTNAFPTTMQNSIWSPSCEFIYFLRKGPGKDHTFHIGKDDFHRDVFEYPVMANRRHPAEKPEPIIERIIRRSSNPGDLIFDPFMGSGTTAVAADRLGRRFFGCDISEEYVEMALERLEKDRAGRQLELL